MGAEAECLVEHGSRASRGKALLETRELRFRGDFRLVIPFTEIKSLTVSDGVLKVSAGSERSLWHLGPQAAKWADRIRNPKSVMDKLGVKSGHKVTVINIADETFMSQLRSRTNDVGRGRARTGCDVIFFGADSARELERVGKLKRYIKPDGAIWVVRPRGSKSIREDDVFRAAKEHGLVDVKVVAFSESHSALKVVVPVARR